MPREAMKVKRDRAARVEERMLAYYGEGTCSLDYETPFHLVVAVMLSAQCSDAAVNKVTPALFRAFPTPRAMASARLEDLETIIHPLGFYHNKAKNLKKMATVLITDFDLVVPDNLDDLQKLPGVGRKTANVVMTEAFKKAQGIAVDTHVFRIAHRLKFAGPSANTPDKTEKSLLSIYPEEQWLFINHQWVQFGRDFCCARNPKCATCFISDLCPSCESPGRHRTT